MKAEEIKKQGEVVVEQDNLVKLIKKIEEIVYEAEKMKGAYFYTPPENASLRRSYEKYHSHGPVEWSEGGHTYSAEYEVSCSCRNVYAKGYYYRDEKRTTITTIKNSLKRLKERAKKEETV